MGRSPCCEKVGLKKGPWTPEEDQKLLAFINEHGHGSWRSLPAIAGLRRCGKSCRLRWTNYLRPDIKRGKFSLQEEQTIIQLHALLGNRWSAIATHLPKRTDNEIKNYWNTHLKKRLIKMGIDPVTHKPKSDPFSSVAGNSKDAANISHMAQWESARLEAEARLVRESKQLLSDAKQQNQFNSSVYQLNKAAQPTIPPCLDVLKAWQCVWFKPTTTTKDSVIVSGNFTLPGTDLKSPRSTLNLPENSLLIPTVGYSSNSATTSVNLACSSNGDRIINQKNHTENDWKSLGKPNQLLQDMWIVDTFRTENGLQDCCSMENLTDLLLDNSDQHNSWDDGGKSFDKGLGSCGGDFDEDHNSYWNDTLDYLVNSSSPVF